MIEDHSLPRQGELIGTRAVDRLPPPSFWSPLGRRVPQRLCTAAGPAPRAAAAEPRDG